MIKLRHYYVGNRFCVLCSQDNIFITKFTPFEDVEGYAASAYISSYCKGW